MRVPFLRSGDKKIYYEDINTDKEKTIVFLHSLGTSSKIWESQLAYFENDFRIVLVDARGHGQSDSSIPFTFKDWANDILLILNELNIEKAHFVGLSMGAHVMLELYLVAPERFSSMLLCNTFAKVPEEIREEKFNSRMELLKQNNFVEEWAKLSLHQNASKALIEKTINLFACTKLDYESTWIAVNQVDYTSMLHTIKVPVLILTGDDDKAAPLRLAEVFHKEIPNSKLEVISEAGHFSNICNPKEFNEKVSKFLFEVSR